MDNRLNMESESISSLKRLPKDITNMNGLTLVCASCYPTLYQFYSPSSYQYDVKRKRNNFKFDFESNIHSSYTLFCSYRTIDKFVSSIIWDRVIILDTVLLERISKPRKPSYILKFEKLRVKHSFIKSSNNYVIRDVCEYLQLINDNYTKTIQTQQKESSLSDDDIRFLTNLYKSQQDPAILLDVLNSARIYFGNNLQPIQEKTFSLWYDSFTSCMDIIGECAICIDNITLDKACNMTCGHFFHRSCIKTWVSTSLKKSCPICRREDIHEIELHQ